MRKLLVLLIFTLTSCSVDNIEETGSFTVPEYFRGTWVIETPVEREGEIVQIDKHSLTIGSLTINTGIDGATEDYVYYSIHGQLTDYLGNQTIYGSHDVQMSIYTTDGMYLTYKNINNLEENIIYITR